jgi:hypothetical protein
MNAAPSPISTRFLHTLRETTEKPRRGRGHHARRRIIITAHSVDIAWAAKHELFTASVPGMCIGVVHGPMPDTIAADGTLPPFYRSAEPAWFAAHARGGLRALRLAACLLTGGALASCSTGGNMFTVFADPGKYEYYSCEQISAQIKIWSSREQELQALMDKAQRSAGGTVVNLLAYQADHVAATEELKVLDATARSKNCNPPVNWQSNTVIR